MSRDQHPSDESTVDFDPVLEGSDSTVGDHTVPLFAEGRSRRASFGHADVILISGHDLKDMEAILKRVHWLIDRHEGTAGSRSFRNVD